jgi:hypothetical protein
MLATLLAALALAGAPASTHAYCNPALPASVELGLTYSDTVQVIDGRVVPGALDNIELGTLACGAIIYTSASPKERAAIRRLNPQVNFDQLVGVGLQVALHEANHVALNSTDECLVEKTTRSEINGLIEKLADPGRVVAADAAATASDASLPSQCHGC